MSILDWLICRDLGENISVDKAKNLNTAIPIIQGPFFYYVSIVHLCCISVQGRMDVHEQML